MCGIVGYVGNKPPVPVILEGLRRLEYRGYDSAGIAVAGSGQGMQIRRAAGKLRNLETAVALSPLDGTYGIGHTRWATHGGPTVQNAHPHQDCTGKIVVVHNGIIENYASLRALLTAEGHAFVTETDTEVIAHLVEKHSAPYNGRAVPLEQAVRLALADLRGVLALAIMSSDQPDKIIAARYGPPAVIGLSQQGYIVASDVPAVLPHTRDMIFLDDGDMAVLTPGGVLLTDFSGRQLQREVQHVTWDPIMAEKGGFRHFMQKEIYEQPRAVRDTLLGHISADGAQAVFDDLGLDTETLRELTHLDIAACGTSWHAALVGKCMLEKLANVSVEVAYASEYRYRDVLVPRKPFTILISQSGETADTLAAQREAHAGGARTLAISNVVGSMLTREADGRIITHAGPEIGVASTKAFTAQLTALALLSLRMAELRATPIPTQRLLHELQALPKKLEQVLSLDGDCEGLASRYHLRNNFLFLGRGIHFPVALEGALKLKEISYVHAEGYPAGEMKHGPNALIDENLVVLVVATRDPNDDLSLLRYEKILSNIKEVKARSGKVIAVITEGDDAVPGMVDHVLAIPPASDLLSPILEIVPAQLFAYHVGVLRGCDVDMPRNLAKSVTVE